MEFLDGSGYILYLAGVAGLLHACLQLPLATLLHMVTHTHGRNHSHKALPLSLAMSVGVFLTIAGLLLVSIIIALSISSDQIRFMIAGILTTLSGVVIMLGYFRGQNGAQLWLSRTYVRWFHKYIERRHNALSAFSLGNLAVLLELGFSLPLLLSAAALLASEDAITAFNGIGLYALIATLPLLFAGISVARGASPIRLQQWRADGKRFWQFFIGLAFILFGLYIASGQFAYAGASL